MFTYHGSYVFGALKAPKRENLLVPLILILTSIKNFFHLSLELYKTRSKVKVTGSNF
jgi:hypothetical protein